MLGSGTEDGEDGHKVVAGILAALVAVVEQAAQRTGAGGHGIFQRADDQAALHVFAGIPAGRCGG